MSPVKPNTIVAVLLSVLLLSLFIVFRSAGLKDSFQRDYDEGVYLTSARLVARGNPIGSAVFSSQPPFFVQSLAINFKIFGDTIPVARWSVFASYGLALILIALIASQIAGPFSAPSAMLLMALTAVFFRQSRVIGSEMPAIVLGLLSIYLTLVFRERPAVAAIAGGVCFGAGCLFKLLIAPMIAPALIVLVLNCRTVSGDRRPLLYSFTYTLAAAITWMAGCLPYGFRAVYEQSVGFQMASQRAQERSQFLPFLADAVRAQPGIPLLALLGLAILIWRKKPEAIFLMAWILSAGMFCFLRRPLFVRHLLVLFPALVIAASANVLWLTELRRGVGRLALAAVMFVAVFGIGHYDGLAIAAVESGSPGPSPADLRLNGQARAMINKYTSPSDLVVTDDQIQVFQAARMAAPALVDTSFMRIKAGSLTDEKTIEASRNARMIIFWTGRLDQLDGYKSWVRTNFDLVYRSDDGSNPPKEIYLRRPWSRRS